MITKYCDDNILVLYFETLESVSIYSDMHPASHFYMRRYDIYKSGIDFFSSDDGDYLPSFKFEVSCNCERMFDALTQLNVDKEQAFIILNDVLKIGKLSVFS